MAEKEKAFIQREERHLEMLNARAQEYDRMFHRRMDELLSEKVEFKQEKEEFKLSLFDTRRSLV